MNLTQWQPKILLIEDNDDDAEIVTSIFLKNNINNPVQRSKTGEDALDYLFQKGKYDDQSSTGLPGIILLDINLPKMNGIDVLRRLRAKPQTEHIPVFIF